MYQETENAYLISPVQRRVWDMYKVNLNLYRECTLQVSENLNIERLEKSFERLCNRYDILRSELVASVGLKYPYLQLKDYASIPILEIKEDGRPSMNSSLEELKIQPIAIYLDQKNPGGPRLKVVASSLFLDTTSVVSLIKEAFEDYGSDQEFGLEEEPIQYLQYATWQNQIAEEPDAEAIDYWQHTIENAENTQPFSFENGASSTTNIYGITECKIARSLKEKLDLKETSLEAFLMTMYAITLKKYVRSDGFALGYVNGIRSYNELFKTKGLMSKLLPISMNIQEDISLSLLVAEIDKQISEAIDWEEYLEAALSAKDVQNTFYNELCFEHIKLPSYTLEGAFNYCIEDVLSYGESFKLKLIVLDKGADVELKLHYHKELIDSVTAHVILKQLEALLTQAIELDTAKVSSLMQVSAWESNLLDSFNHENIKRTAGTLTDLVEKQAEIYPNKVAIIGEEASLTFAELIAKSNRMASGIIRKKGSIEGQIVAIHVPRSEHLIISILAILKLGGTYLILDNALPTERINFILKDSESGLLITASAMERVIDHQYLLDELVQCGGAEKYSNSNTDNAAYLIYTSGSTGTPKGVMVSHDAIVNYAQWFIKEAALTHKDTSLLLSSLAYDLSYTSFWPCLLAGGSVALLPDQQMLEPKEVAKQLIAAKVTYVKLTPSHFKMILDDPLFKENVAKYQLRLIVLGGENIVSADLEKYFDQNKSIVFFNHFGPTETTVGTIFERIEYQNFYEFKQKPLIGSPIDNSKVYILKEDTLNLVPIGAVGEICVGGIGVANCYLNNPELTQRKFVSYPNGSGTRIYRTGDLGRWLANGKIQYLGRNDDQIKLRGFRIELGEIEKQILKQEQIQKACVILQDGILSAFVKSDSFNESEVKKYLADQLPEYMRPNRWVLVDDFPLNPNGKINKKELIHLAPNEVQRKYFPPRNIMETLLVDIWCNVLNQERIGIEDNFFDLGGHSLKATQIVLQVFKQLQVSVGLKDLVNNPTIKQFSEVLKQAASKKYESISVLDSDQIYYDISHAQKRLWLIDQFRENQQAYNIHSSFQIKGDLNLEALQATFLSVIQRHEILRTNFVVMNGSVKQFIYDKSKVNFELEVFDFSKSPNAVEEAKELAEQEMNYVFCLKNDSLIRAKLIKLDSEKHVLVLTMHHIIADGWSLRILMMELSQMYYIKETGGETQLEPLRIQYKDYTYWHNKMIVEHDEQYWLKKLSNPPEFINLPYSPKRNHTTKSEQELYKTMAIDGDQFVKLKELAKRFETTMSNLMLSAYGIMLNKISGQNDIVIGIGHANRNHPDIENLIGFFVNLLPIRMLFDKNDDFENVIKQISTSTFEAFEHSNYPFELLIEKVCPDRYSNNQPLVNVLYDYKNYHDIDISGVEWNVTPSLAISPFQRLRNRSKFDLTLFVYQHDQSLKMYFEYDDYKFSERTIDRMNILLMSICKLLTEVV